MTRDEMVVEILTDLVEGTLDIEGSLFEAAEVAADPHSRPETGQAIQAGALAAGRTAGLEAKAAGLDRHGVRFAVAQAVRTHTEHWRKFREEHPAPLPKQTTDDEHVKRVDGLEKTVKQLQADKALDAQKARIEMAKMKADAKIEIIRMRAAQKMKSMAKKKAGR